MEQLFIELTEKEKKQIFGGKVIYKVIVINGEYIQVAEYIPD